MTRERRLWVVLGLNLALLGVLIGVGLRAGSLGLLAAAGDYIADVGAICIALMAIWLKKNNAHDPRFDRAPTVAALINVILLIAVVAWVLVEAIHRLWFRAIELEALPVIWTAVLAAVLMTVGAIILGGDIDGDDDTTADRLNMRAVLLDTVADAVSAAAVALTGLIVLLTNGWQWLDPIVAVVIALVVGYHAVKLLSEVHDDLRGAND